MLGNSCTWTRLTDPWGPHDGTGPLRSRSSGETDVPGGVPCGYFLRPAVLRVERLREPPRLRGTLPPSRRASLRPIAIACLRLVTFRPERPDFSVPRFRSCIARSTLLCAFFPYLAMRADGAR